MKKTLLCLGLLLTYFGSQAQLLSGPEAAAIQKDAQQIRYDHRSTAPLYIEFKPNSFISAGSGFESLRKVLEMSSGDSWQIIRSDKDDLGMTHERFQQYYNQIKVETGEYILHQSQGRIVAANGMFFTHLNISTTPSLNEKAALQKALSNIGANKYLWDLSQNAQDLWLGHDHAAAYPKGELVILPSMGFEKQQQSALCWKFDVYAAEPHERYFIYVNAQSGKIEFKENRICTIAVTGSANTKYSGTQSIITDSVSAGNYRLRDATRGGGVETYNLLNGTNYGAAVDFTDADNNWTSVVNQDNAALDAHYGAEKTYDYYLSVHGRNSWNNLGGILKSYVHYSTAYNNAFWNGSVMTYGDGDGSTFSPLTELDICGHELSHGVTASSSNLVYSNESGALNESFSDIFGVSVDFFARPATANWTLADQSYTPATPGDGIRYMNNPNAAGNPDTYLGTSWYAGTADNGGVHTNSGVQNFWYYLLCTGGSGTNDGGFVYNVANITMAKARLIAYRNNTFYLTSGSQYADAGFYSLKSATDIYGPCSPEAYAVKNAWDAVGIYGLSLNANATASVSGSSCTGGTIQLAATGGNTYQWSGPGGFTSALQNPTIANAAAGNAGTYTCLVTTATGCTSTPTVVVALNASPTVSATGGTGGCQGNPVQLTANATVPGQGGNTGFNATAVAIPDNNATGITSNITISGSSSANALISVKIDSLIHTWDADLKIELIAPNGSTIILANQVGGSGDNFIRTNFITSAVTAIASGTAPFTGNFLPSTPFSGLSGSANGIWKLKISDLAGQDIGTLYKWSIVLPGNAIASYSWTPPATLNNAAIFNPVASPTSTTTYTVTVTDNSGCTASANTTVNVSNVSASTSITNVTCFDGLNGVVNLLLNGGSTPYTINWSNGATTSGLIGVGAGNYNYSVTDAGGCTINGTASVTQPTQLIAQLTPVSASCGIANGGVNVTVSGGSPAYSYFWSNNSFNQNLTNVSAGNYTLTVSDQNGCNATSSVAVDQTGQVLVSSIVTDASCGSSNGAVNITVTGAVAPVSYLWSNGAISQNIAGVVGGTYTVTVTSGNGCSGTATATVGTSGGSVAAPGAISGPTSACQNQSGVQYGVAAVAGATSYAWTLPAGATGSSTNNTITVNFGATYMGGNICVSALSPCGNSTASCQNLTRLTARPVTPASIAGGTISCPSSIKIFTTPSVVNATTYNWTVPVNASIISGQGTTSLTVSFNAAWVSGTLTVNATNCIGTSSNRTLALVSKPSTPSSIIGNKTAVCAGSTQVYSCPTTANATSYNWTVPAGAVINSGQGTTSISVTFPIPFLTGSVTVNGVNACTSGTVRSTNVRSTPAQPGVITGVFNNLCSSTSSYSIVASSTGATSYNWTVPAGAIILSGQGTTSISVQWPATNITAGSICVTSDNSCGSSTSRCQTGVTTLPARPAAISGATTVCASQTGVAFSCVTQPGVTYTWTVPAGSTIVSGQGTGTISVNWGSTAGNVGVKAVNSCGIASVRSLAVTINCRVEAMLAMNVNLFPNPATEETILSFDGIPGKYAVEVFDILGKSIFAKQSDQEQLTLQLNNIVAGVYFVKIQSEEGIQKTLRLVKE